MIGEVGVETWLAAAYCLVLVAMAYVIDALARRAGAAADGGATFGFTFHEDHDAWRCPQDQWLWPHSFDPDHRVMRYRAKPAVCNACPVKDTCTPSRSGREVQRPIDAWPASEAARFHRGIACTVVVLGLVWPVGMLLATPGRTESLVLGVAMVTAVLVSLPLWTHLRRSAVVLPEGIARVALDDVVRERAATAETAQRRRTTFGSDQRERQGGAPW